VKGRKSKVGEFGASRIRDFWVSASFFAILPLLSTFDISLSTSQNSSPLSPPANGDSTNTELCFLVPKLRAPHR